MQDNCKKEASYQNAILVCFFIYLGIQFFSKFWLAFDGAAFNLNIFLGLGFNNVFLFSRLGSIITYEYLPVLYQLLGGKSFILSSHIYSLGLVLPAVYSLAYLVSFRKSLSPQTFTVHLCTFILSYLFCTNLRSYFIVVEQSASLCLGWMLLWNYHFNGNSKFRFFLMFFSLFSYPLILFFYILIFFLGLKNKKLKSIMILFFLKMILLYPYHPALSEASGRLVMTSLDNVHENYAVIWQLVYYLFFLIFVLLRKAKTQLLLTSIFCLSYFFREAPIPWHYYDGRSFSLGVLVIFLIFIYAHEREWLVNKKLNMQFNTLLGCLFSIFALSFASYFWQKRLENVHLKAPKNQVVNYQDAFQYLPDYGLNANGWCSRIFTLSLQILKDEEVNYLILNDPPSTWDTIGRLGGEEFLERLKDRDIKIQPHVKNYLKKELKLE